jgi:multicomponent Na+:H+ antiporter subunit E
VNGPVVHHPRLAVLQFVALFGFWLALSWRLDPLYLAMGFFAAAGITVATQRITSTIVHADRVAPPLSRFPLLTWRFVAFTAWILGRIVTAGFQMARIITARTPPIDPVELRFRTELASPMARTVFTNSITLVPGTLTVDLDGNMVVVHALFPSATDDLISGELQNRVARLFDEPVQPPAEATWLTLPHADPTAPDPTDSSLGQRRHDGVAGDLDSWQDKP